MSAADDLRAYSDEEPMTAWRRATNDAAADELDALRAELSALKARRCDGCVHASQVDVNSGWNPDEYRQCNVQAQADAPMFSDCSGRTAKWQEIVVDVSHSCAAWTEKP